MKQYLHNIFPAEFHEQPEYFRALTLAVVYVILFILQLFTYEKFYPIVAAYGLPGGSTTAVILAGLVPILEAGALPYLLSMKISHTLRSFSRVFVVLVPVVWLVVALWLVTRASASTEAGVFGATITTYSGVWVVLFFAMLLISAIVVVRELPARHP